MVINIDSLYNSFSEYKNTEAYIETDKEIKNRITDLSRGLIKVKKHNKEDSI